MRIQLSLIPDERAPVKVCLGPGLGRSEHTATPASGKWTLVVESPYCLSCPVQVRTIKPPARISNKTDNTRLPSVLFYQKNGNCEQKIFVADSVFFLVKGFEPCPVVTRFYVFYFTFFLSATQRDAVMDTVPLPSIIQFRCSLSHSRHISVPFLLRDFCDNCLSNRWSKETSCTFTLWYPLTCVRRTVRWHKWGTQWQQAGNINSQLSWDS